MNMISMMRLPVAVGLALLTAGAVTSFAADTTTTTPPPAATQSPPPAATDAQTPATPPASDQQTPATTEPDPNEKICKKDDTTGSRMKVCKTRKEWEEQAKDSGGF